MLFSTKLFRSILGCPHHLREWSGAARAGLAVFEIIEPPFNTARDAFVLGFPRHSGSAGQGGGEIYPVLLCG